MKVGKIIAFLGIILLVAGLFSGCKEVDDYVGGLDESVIEAEKVKDQALAKTLQNAAQQSALDQSAKGGNTDKLSWGNMKKCIDKESVAYLESLEEDSFSHKTLSDSIRDGGWIQVRQGWITISKGNTFNFTYTTQKP